MIHAILPLSFFRQLKFREPAIKQSSAGMVKMIGIENNYAYLLIRVVVANHCSSKFTASEIDQIVAAVRQSLKAVNHELKNRSQ